MTGLTSVPFDSSTCAALSLVSQHEVDVPLARVQLTWSRPGLICETDLGRSGRGEPHDTGGDPSCSLPDPNWLSFQERRGPRRASPGMTEAGRRCRTDWPASPEPLRRRRLVRPRGSGEPIEVSTPRECAVGGAVHIVRPGDIGLYSTTDRRALRGEELQTIARPAMRAHAERMGEVARLGDAAGGGLILKAAAAKLEQVEPRKYRSGELVDGDVEVRGRAGVGVTQLFGGWLPGRCLIVLDDATVAPVEERFRSRSKSCNVVGQSSHFRKAQNVSPELMVTVLPMSPPPKSWKPLPLFTNVPLQCSSAALPAEFTHRFRCARIGYDHLRGSSRAIAVAATRVEPAYRVIDDANALRLGVLERLA